jgi:hypothetical protein
MKTHRAAIATLAALLFGLASPANPGETPPALTECPNGALPAHAIPWNGSALDGLGEPLNLPPTLLTDPNPNLGLLIKTLGELIVESQLQRAAVSGRFDREIVTVVAGSRFDLRVCRETIFGAVSIDSAADRGLEFMIGDFDHDGRMDVALRRAGSDTWIMDLARDDDASPASGAALPARGLTARELPHARSGGCRIAEVAARDQALPGRHAL